MRLYMENNDQKKKAAERIKQLRTELGLDQKQFAVFLGKEEEFQSTISKWERQKQIPGAEYTALLSQKTGKSQLYFSGLDEVVPAVMSSGRRYPLAGEIQAGAWTDGVETPEYEADFVTLPDVMDVPPYKMKAFRVRGDSMDKYYPEGSIVFVAGLFENHIRPESGDVVLVRVQGKNGLFENTLKEYVIDDEGRKWLWPRSYAPEFQAPLYIDQHRDEDSDVVIAGIVQASITKARKRK